MKTIIRLTTIIIVSTLVFSCGKNKQLVQSESTVNKFFNAINKEDEDSMSVYFPEISTFDSYFKSDSIKIKNSKFLNDSLVLVSTTNYFTNGFGKQTIKDIELFVIPDSIGEFSKISDSKGLTDFKENKLYSFATKTGCLQPTDSTDVLKNEKFTAAYLFAYKLTLDKMIDFKLDVKVVDWSWKKGYGNSASGKAIVKNNSTFSIPNVKYEITYYDRSDNKITTDDGYVSYDALGAGDSKSFTFYTSYVGNASSASITLNFDEDLINDYVLQSEYEGNEYSDYLAEKESSKDISAK